MLMLPSRLSLQPAAVRRTVRNNAARAALKPAETDRIGGKVCFLPSEPPLAERCSGQAPLRTADMKLVGLVAKTGEPADQLVPDNELPLRRCEDAVVLDRQ